MTIKIGFDLLDRVYEKKEVFDSFFKFLEKWVDEKKTYFFLREVTIIKNKILIFMDYATSGMAHNFEIDFFIYDDFSVKTLISSFEKSILDKERKQKEEAELIKKLKETKEWQNLQEGYDLIPKQYNYIF